MKERRPINTADDHGTETGAGGRVRGMRGRLRRRSGKPLPVHTSCSAGPWFVTAPLRQ
jgi:hypothetical protein